METSTPLQFPYHENPDLRRAYERERDWLERWRLIGDARTRRRFQHYEPAKMIGYTFPDAQGAAYDVAVDMSCFFLYTDRIIDDHYFDKPEQARRFLQEIVDVLDDDLASYDLAPSESAAQMFAEVWSASSAGMSWQWKHRAARNWMDYLWANLTEALQRYTRSTPSDLGSYLPNRRLSGGPMPTFDMYEPVYGFELPASAYYQQHLTRMLTVTCDLCVLGNDLASYKREDATGDSFNAVLILRDHQGLTLDQARDAVTSTLFDRQTEYQRLRTGLAPLCEALGYRSRSTDAVMQWAACLDHWNGGFFAWQFEPIRCVPY